MMKNMIVMTRVMWWNRTLQMVQYLSLVAKLKKGGGANNALNQRA